MPRWTQNNGLTLKDIRVQHHARIVAERAGRPLRGFLTLTPLRSVPGGERANLLHAERSRLRQRLKRPPFGFEFIGMFIREKAAEDEHDTGEHGHGFVWLPEDIDTDTLMRCFTSKTNAQLDWNEGEAGIKARLDYVQKERCGRAEGWMKLHHTPRYTHEPPAPLDGPRWSMTKGLAALVEADAYGRTKVYTVRKLAPPAPVVVVVAEIEAAPPPLRIVVVNAMVADPVQLSMFPIADRPVSRLSNFAGHILPAVIAVEVEARRRWRGMTQAQLAAEIGISRPTLVNVLKGRFPLSVWAAARLREFLLPLAEAA